MRSCCYLVLFLCLATAPLACQLNTTGTSAQLLKTAEAGDAQAQFELGRAYEDGKGVPQDDARAVEWFRKSAEQGNAQAQNSLGVMCALGRGVPRDREEAVRWYKKAAKQGMTEAIYNVATSYYNGEGIGEDTSLAYAWMMAAQKRGDAQAAEALQHMREALHDQLEFGQLDLARLYEKGDEIPQDMHAAVALYLDAANLKPDPWITEVRYKVCLFYIDGTVVPQDYGQARSWCKKSGSAQSIFVLGRLAEKGLGGDKNSKEAMDYYRKAAALNLPEACMEAGRLQSESGSHEGEKKAYFWYAIAAERRAVGAAEKLQAAASHLSEKEITEQQKQVMKWLLMRDWMRDSEAKKH
jgi:TPR repeat protein